MISYDDWKLLNEISVRNTDTVINWDEWWKVFGVPSGIDPELLRNIIPIVERFSEKFSNHNNLITAMVRATVLAAQKGYANEVTRAMATNIK